MTTESKSFKKKYEYRAANRKTENKRANQDEINSLRKYAHHLNELIKQESDGMER